MAVPNVFSANTKIKSADTNANNNAITNMTAMDPDSCKAYLSGSQSASSGVVTGITFDAEVWDTNSMHSIVTNNSRFTTQRDGKYRMMGQVGLVGNSNGVRQVMIYKNGFLLTQTDYPANSSQPTIYPVVCEDNATAGDYYELVIFQDSGSSLTIRNGVTDTWFVIEMTAKKT